jgi:hypothetical protein
MMLPMAVPTSPRGGGGSDPGERQPRRCLAAGATVDATSNIRRLCAPLQIHPRAPSATRAPRRTDTRRRRHGVRARCARHARAAHGRRRAQERRAEARKGGRAREENTYVGRAPSPAAQCARGGFGLTMCLQRALRAKSPRCMASGRRRSPSTRRRRRIARRGRPKGPRRNGAHLQPTASDGS